MSISWSKQRNTPEVWMSDFHFNQTDAFNVHCYKYSEEMELLGSSGTVISNETFIMSIHIEPHWRFLMMLTDDESSVWSTLLKYCL